MECLDIVKAERIRVCKKFLIYILIGVSFCWATFEFYHAYSQMDTYVKSGVKWVQLDYGLQWSNLLSTAGSLALCGWGSLIYIFFGAFWIGDDLETKMLWNIAMASRKLYVTFFSKLLTLLMFLLCIHLMIWGWLSCVSVFIYGIPGGGSIPPAHILRFLASTFEMFFYALSGAFLAILFNNPAFGSFIGIFIDFASRIIFSVIFYYPHFLMKVNPFLLTFNMQRVMFGGTPEQGAYVIGGNIEPKMFLSLSESLIGMLIYAAVFIALGYLLYCRRARS